MLLEGLDKPAGTQPGSKHDLNKQHSQQPIGHNRRGASAKGAQMRQHQEVSPAASVDSGSLVQYEPDDGEDECDCSRNRQTTSGESHDHELDFNSEESGSQDQIQVSPQIQSKHHHRSHQQQQQSMNKSINRRLLEQRSSASRAFGPLMQSKATSTNSESICTSSSGYGDSGRRLDAARLMADENEPSEGSANEDLIPSRTIAIQCDLKLSSVKRDGYLLTDSASSDLASMQASSISSTRYGFYRLTPETLGQRRLLARSISSRNIAHLEAEADGGQAGGEPAHLRAPSEAGSSTADTEAREELGHAARPRADGAGPRHEQRAPPAGRPDRRLERRLQRDQQAAERARGSLPHRPKTALSYVSNSRLGGEEASDRSLSGLEDDEPAGALRNRRPLNNRAVSHELLSGPGARAAIVRAPLGREIDTISSTSSEGELGERERYRVPCSEEILLTRRSQQVPLAAAPTNYSAARTRPNGAASRTGPAQGAGARRSQTLTDGLGHALSASRQPIRSSDSREPAESRRVQKCAKFVEGGATGARSSDEEPRRLSRFSSMSLSRAPSRSCNLIGGQIRRATAATPTRNANEPPAATGGGRRPNRPGRGRAGSGGLGAAGASMRKDRSSSQQALSGGTRTMAPSCCLEAEQGAASRQIGRSSSMKQVNSVTNNGARLLSPGGEQRVSGRSCATDCDSSCCEQAGPGRPLAAARRSSSRLAEGAHESAAPLQRPERPSGAVKRSESEDSESPVTRTWANPSSARVSSARQTPRGSRAAQRVPSRAARRSHSMRDAANGLLNYHHQHQQPRQDGSDVDDHDDHYRDDHDDEEEEDEDEACLHRLESIGDRGLTNERFERIYRTNQAAEEARAAAEARAGELGSQSEESSEQGTNSAGSSLATGRLAPGDLLTRAAVHHQQLDFDSQQRLNAIGLPELDGRAPLASSHTLNRRNAAAVQNSASSASSHLGLARAFAGSSQYATTGRRPAYARAQPLGAPHHGPAITGRALSQQSLTRPTMPLSRRLRRSGNASGSQSAASDVGGSSMSLVSRMRYENAHTRTPVVMYIPQAMPKSSSSEHIRRSSSTLLRRSSRQSASKPSRHSSQDRAARKGASRQASDSEGASSSSMLRTLVKPRSSRLQSAATGNGAALSRAPSGCRRPPAARGRELSDDEETMDRIGQLATEIDSYKFRRRYSVPKDAKINWFSKLKQRVTSKG